MRQVGSLSGLKAKAWNNKTGLVNSLTFSDTEDGCHVISDNSKKDAFDVHAWESKLGDSITNVERIECVVAFASNKWNCSLFHIVLACFLFLCQFWTIDNAYVTKFETYLSLGESSFLRQFQCALFLGYSLLFLWTINECFPSRLSVPVNLK